VTRDYRHLSLWHDTAGEELAPRPPLPGDTQVDVVIVGAGYTGLWTAYYLARADPSLRIAILDSEIAGFGASGRNGGWCSALFAAGSRKLEKIHGRQGRLAMRDAMRATLDEIEQVLGREGIDAKFVKGGTLTLATRVAHLRRLRAHAYGHDEQSDEDDVWLEPRDLQQRLRAQSCFGALFAPHCAAVHPTRLVRGLARCVEGLGVKIYERTRATALRTGSVRTMRGRVTADVVVRATEGYTAQLERHRRVLLPIYSLMIATEPLPPSFWAEVGWDQRETLTDGRQMLIYAQRTWDDRIAIGGRGAPYHFGSRLDDGFESEPRVFGELHKALVTLFPQARDAAIRHRWGGPLGAPRDWQSSVGYERASGMAWAGGYVGDGVSTANLAGRTLRDLILGRDTEIARLPWVNHRSRKWEPEPLRWAGARLALWTAASADRAEERSGRPSPRAALLGAVIGRRV